MLIISSTNRKGSKSLRVAGVYKQLLDEAGVFTEILSLENLPLDFIQSALYDNIGKNRAFNEFQSYIHRYDKMIFVVPEYNGSFPGILKTFMDGLRHPDSFGGKKGALVGISSGAQGGGLALSHLTDILHYMGMHILAIKPKLSNIDSNLSGDKLTNPVYLEKIKRQISEMIKF